jgi:DNA repair protein RadD
VQLRPRQETFKDKCVAALDERGNTLGVAPTGAGKTVMLSAITGHYVGQGASALVIQHRDELVSQNRATFEKVNPRSTTGIFTADRKEWGYAATFAMIQTLAGAKNLEGMPPVDVLAIDEGHHAVADSYLRTIDAARKRNPDVRLLLVTATPNRGDKKALRGVVDNVADQISLKELIEGRFLVRPRTLVVDIGVTGELAGVKKTMADFDMTAVEAIMDKEVLNDRIVDEWSKVAGDRQTVAFCSTVKHAAHVAEAFRARGIRAATVEGNMSANDRRETLAAYDRGEIQVITNVAVLTEGWDHQPTSCVILLRPSSYKSTMIQMIGRGLRKVEPERYPGVVKDDCIIMDFGTSILTHGSIEQDVDIDQEGTKDCPDCTATVPSQCRSCAICGYEWPRPEPLDGETIDPAPGEGEAPKPRGELSSFILTEVDLLAATPFRYEHIFDGVVSIASAMDAWGLIVTYQGRWHAIGGGKAIGIRHLADTHDRLLAMATADDFLREHGDASAANKSKRWMSEPPTDKQLEVLGLTAMGAMGLGVNKYRAACLMTWKFNERAVRGILERSKQRMAA